MTKEVGSEPSMPDFFILRVEEERNAQGQVKVVAKVDPARDCQVQLEILAPANQRFESGGRMLPFNLTRGGDGFREDLMVDVSGGQPTTLRVALHLLDSNGNRTMSLEQRLEFNRASSEAGQSRVPVVQTLPDGRKVVSYMTRQQAEDRGLGEDGLPLPSNPPVRPERRKENP